MKWSGPVPYSAAARALGYTQPAITQQMKALERDVGTPLFIRVGRGMRLTEAGEALSRHAAVILDSMSAAQQQMSALTRLRAGRVRVCAFPSANATLIPEAMARLAAAHPGVRVDLLESEPPESLHRLVAGSATSRSPSPIPACTKRCRTSWWRSRCWRTS